MLGVFFEKAAEVVFHTCKVSGIHFFPPVMSVIALLQVFVMVHQL